MHNIRGEPNTQGNPFMPGSKVETLPTIKATITLSWPVWKVAQHMLKRRGLSEADLGHYINDLICRDRRRKDRRP